MKNKNLYKKQIVPFRRVTLTASSSLVSCILSAPQPFHIY